MLSFKPALALCALGIGAGAIGAAMYVSSNPPQSPEPPTPRATVQKAASYPTSVMETARVIVLEPVTVVGVLRRSSAQAPAAVPETRLEHCSDWRQLAVGPAERTVRNLCAVEVVMAAPP